MEWATYGKSLPPAPSGLPGQERKQWVGTYLFCTLPPREPSTPAGKLCLSCMPLSLEPDLPFPISLKWQNNIKIDSLTISSKAPRAGLQFIRHISITGRQIQRKLLSDLSWTVPALRSHGLKKLTGEVAYSF